MNKKFLLAILLLVSNEALPQTTKNPGFGTGVNSQEVCSNLAFGSDEEVDALVNKILDYANVLNRNYKIIGCTNVSSCFATVINEQQYIVYKPDYLKNIKTYGFTNASLPAQDIDWQALTILAHEVGHLVNSHFYKCAPNMTDWDKELQADEFAGRIIYQLNGSLDQALSVYYTSLVSESGGMTHPPRKERTAAVSKGYNSAKRLFPRQNENPPVHQYNPNIVKNDPQQQINEDPPQKIIVKNKQTDLPEDPVIMPGPEKVMPELPTIYNYVEIMPKAGFDLNNYENQNLKYPDIARNANIEGRVIVKFVVNEDGRISDCQVLRGIGGGCDEEALRVIKNMPPWKPGSQNGKPVKVFFTQSINFKLTSK